MSNQVAFIVIDSGFSREAMTGAPVIAFYDLLNRRTAIGAPYLDEETLTTYAGDQAGHGSVVLQGIRELAPNAPLILIRALSDKDNSLIRTAWENGLIVSNGWTEAYKLAVELCQKRDLLSVANCSFGGYRGPMTGEGWESYQLGRVTGPGRCGHVMVVAAGPGDGRAAHASWATAPGHSTDVRVFQKTTSRYNLWAGLGGNHADTVPGDWTLQVHSPDGLTAIYSACEIAENIWNNRRQLNFTIEGSGLATLKLSRSTQAASSGYLRFDCWAIDDDEDSAFLNHVDPTLIAEPAIFPHVIAVGLNNGWYSPRQSLPEEKPEVLIEGEGPISFRLPEVVVTAGALLAANPNLDVTGVRKLLGKYPRLSALPG